MITIQLFPETFLVVFLFIFLVTVVICKIKKNRSISLFFLGLFEMYILMIFSTAILPIRIIDSDLFQVEFDVLKCIQLIPFRTLHGMISSDTSMLRQILGNIVLFLPLPFFWGFILKNKKNVEIFVLSILASFFVEFAQLVIDVITRYPSRFFDIDDIMLNTMGILIGIIIYTGIKRFSLLYEWLERSIVYIKK